MDEQRFHITDQLCACGCGTQLASTIVGRGWKFIRGHKAGKVSGRVAVPKSAPRPGPVTVVGMEQVRSFRLQNDKLIADQLFAARERVAALKREIDSETAKIDRLMAERPKFKAALNALGSAAS